MVVYHRFSCIFKLFASISATLDHPFIAPKPFLCGDSWQTQQTLNDRGCPDRSSVARPHTFGDLPDPHIADICAVGKSPRRRKGAAIGMAKFSENPTINTPLSSFRRIRMESLIGSVTVPCHPFAQTLGKQHFAQITKPGYASRCRIHSTSGAGTNRHLRSGPAMTFR